MKTRFRWAHGAFWGIVVMASVVVSTACHKDQPTPSGASASASAAPGGSVPTPQDYESQAKAAITPENLDSQLDAIEKEVTSDNRK